MPEFNGPLSHSSDSAKLLELALQQTRGIGIFNTVSERNSLSEANRSSPYLAYMCNDDKLYVYDGPRQSVAGLDDKFQLVDNSDWTNTNNWTAVGSSTGSGIDNVHEDASPQLGGNLDVHYNGTTRSIINSNDGDDIKFTPTVTGKINLDGLVFFKEFDSSSPPDPFEGGMYRDNNDNLYFGVS
tara:strand:- start:83 stop:634 length:552 start_codon:yes stop_codon:yes gene_type:complete